VATKAAAFGVFLRLFFDALGSAQTNWAPALAALATITIIIGNVGALAQRSMKRLLAWSSVGQAGYLLAGVVVGTELGLQATMFYLAVYGLMNIAAFAVVIARERVDERGDDIDSLENLGRASPWLAWPMTIAMLSLAGFPATAGFMGKFYLIDATVQGDYAWLGVVIVIGSIISLGYYLRVIAVMWLGAVDVELPTPARRRVARVGGWSPATRCANPKWSSWRWSPRRPRSSSASCRTRCSTQRAKSDRRWRTCSSRARHQLVEVVLDYRP
jgi:NADH-quinone oxidoreductase subunit N